MTVQKARGKMSENSTVEGIIRRTVRSLASYLAQAGEKSPKEALLWIRRIKREMEHLEEIAVLRAINAGYSKSECAQVLKITRQTLDNRYKEEIDNLRTRKASSPSSKVYIEDFFFHGRVKPAITETPAYMRAKSEQEPLICICKSVHEEKRGDRYKPLLIEWKKFCEEEESTGHKPSKAAFARRKGMSRPTLVRKLKIAETSPDTPDTPKIFKLNFDQRNSKRS